MGISRNADKGQEKNSNKQEKEEKIVMEDKSQEKKSKEIDSGTNDKLNVVYKKPHKKDLSENRTKNQQQNEIIPTENHNETNKKNIKDKETIKKTKISDDTENKSKS